MAQAGEKQRRKNRMKVRQAQAEMIALLPAIEELVERFREIDKKLEPCEPTDRLVFGRPGRESLRYSVASSAGLAADSLLEALRHARCGAVETHANLMADWEAKQRRESERVRESWRFGPRPVGSC